MRDSGPIKKMLRRENDNNARGRNFYCIKLIKKDRNFLNWSRRKIEELWKLFLRRNIGLKFIWKTTGSKKWRRIYRIRSFREMFGPGLSKLSNGRSNRKGKSTTNSIKPNTSEKLSAKARRGREIRPSEWLSQWSTDSRMKNR